MLLPPEVNVELPEEGGYEPVPAADPWDLDQLLNEDQV